jgi:putative tryptophan/tyrosine transport system substrate-binding protein
VTARPGDSRRRATLAILGAIGLYMGVRAQTPPLRRIAWISSARENSAAVSFDAFIDGLRERGHALGHDVAVETRWGNDSPQRTDEHAIDLARDRYDVIVAQGPAILSLLRAAAKSPVVFAFSGDPVEAALVDSLARPGRNMTGISMLSHDLVGKRLQLLKEALPGLTKVALIAQTTHAGEQGELRASRAAASTLGLGVEYVPIRSADRIDDALAAVLQSRSDAISVFPSASMMRQSERIAEFAARWRVPAISGWAEFAERGNLLSYGPNMRAMFKRLADYADRVLKGARPAEMPVEFPTVVELVVNLKAAKSLAIAVPSGLLLRADRVIE